MTLKEKIIDCGFSYNFQDVAKLLGYSKSSISRVNRGLDVMSLRMAQAFVREFGNTRREKQRLADTEITKAQFDNHASADWWRGVDPDNSICLHEQLIKDGWASNKYHTAYMKGNTTISAARNVVWVVKINHEEKGSAESLTEALKLLG